MWSVDYRMPPDHPFPTPLDDCLAAYRALLEERRPEEIIVGGASAGGNLAGALVLRARDEGLPLPAAVVFNTGAFDLTRRRRQLAHERRTRQRPRRLRRRRACTLYAGGHDLGTRTSRRCSATSRGFPPTILLTGTRDMLLSDNVRMHRALRAAGVDAELHVWEAAGHGGFLGMAPEDADRAAELRRFAERALGARRRGLGCDRMIDRLRSSAGVGVQVVGFEVEGLDAPTEVVAALEVARLVVERGAAATDLLGVELSTHVAGARREAEAGVDDAPLRVDTGGRLMCSVQLQCTVTSPVRVGSGDAREIEVVAHVDLLDVGAVRSGDDTELAVLLVGAGDRDARRSAAAAARVAAQRAVLVPRHVGDALDAHPTFLSEALGAVALVRVAVAPSRRR